MAKSKMAFFFGFAKSNQVAGFQFHVGVQVDGLDVMDFKSLLASAASAPSLFLQMPGAECSPMR